MRRCPRCGRTCFAFIGRNESQHAVLDEAEWKREDARLSLAQRDRSVDDLIALIGAVDGMLQAQAAADAGYFVSMLKRELAPAMAEAVASTFLRAYRYQYFASGVQHRRFPEILFGMLNEAQRQRINESPLIDALSLMVPAARVVQSLMHIGFVETKRTVSLRFSAFSVQLVCFFVLAGYALLYR